MIVSYVLILSTILSFIFGYKLLAKNNFKLNGLEILLYQIAFLFIFHIGSYIDKGNTDIFKFCGTLILIILIYYYILRMIKTKQYIRWPMFIIYILIIIINAYSLNFIPMEGWDSLGYALLYFIYSAITILTLLLINLITLIIRSVKKIKTKDKSLFLKKEVIINIIILSSVIPIIYGMNEEKRVILENEKIIENYKNKVLNYLDKKYKNGNFEIVEVYDKTVFDISTSYFDETFQIEIYDDEIYDEEFLIKYYAYTYDLNIDSYFELKEYLIKYIRHKYLNEFNADIIINSLDVSSSILKEQNFENINTLDKLIETIKINIDEVIIYKPFTKEESNEFCKYIIDLYEKLKYEETILEFKFNYDNPFSTSLPYKDEGYLRNDETRYLVYIDASPIQVKK